MWKALTATVLLCLPPAAVLAMWPDPLPSSPVSEAAAQRVLPRLETELAARDLQLGAPIFIRVFKEESELELFVQGRGGFELFRTYPICEHSGALGPKRRRGDLQAPEGFYAVTAEWMNPRSRFHLSFNIGYPNAHDRALGRSGSAIMVHGGCQSTGCFAMTDQAMEEIYVLAEAALRHSQTRFYVHAFPFRMTRDNLARHAESRWQPFWSNLQPGYDYFEHTRFPPRVGVLADRYVFAPHDTVPKLLLALDALSDTLARGAAASGM